MSANTVGAGVAQSV